MKKNTFKKLIFGSSGLIIAVGTIILTINSQRDNKNAVFNSDQSFENTVLTFDKNKNTETTSKLNTTSAEIIINPNTLPPITDVNEQMEPTDVMPDPTDTRSVDQIQAAYELANKNFVAQPSDANYAIIQKERMSLAKKIAEDANSVTDAQKKLNASFDKLIDNFKQYINFAKVYTSTLLVKNYPLADFYSKTLIAQIDEMQKDTTLSTENRAFVRSILRIVSPSKTSLITIKNFNLYLESPSDSNKTTFENSLLIFSFLPSVERENSPEMKLASTLKTFKTFLDTIHKTNKLFNQNFSMPVSLQKLNEEVVKLSPALKILSEDTSVNADDFGKIVLAKLSYLVTEIETKYNVVNSLVQYSSSLENASKTKFETDLNALITKLEQSFKNQATLSGLTDAETVELFKPIKSGIFSKVLDQYLKATELGLNIYTEFLNLSKKPMSQPQMEISTSIDKLELLIQRAKSLTEEIAQIVNPSIRVTKNYSEFVEEFKTKNASDAEFADKSKEEFDKTLSELKSEHTKLSSEFKTANAELINVNDNKDSTAIQLFMANNKQDLARWKLDKFNDLTLNISSSTTSIGEILSLKFKSLKLKKDIENNLNTYVVAANVKITNIFKLGKKILSEKSVLKDIENQISNNQKTLVNSKKRQKVLMDNTNRTPQEESELMVLKTLISQLEATVVKLKESATTTNVNIDNMVFELDTFTTEELAEAEKVALKSSTDALQVEETKTSSNPQINKNLYLENVAKVLEYYDVLKSNLSYYFDDQYSFVSNSQELKSAISEISKWDGVSQDSISERNLSIINMSFENITKDLKLYETFAKTVIADTDENKAELQEIFTTNSADINLLNLVNLFIEFNKVRQDLYKDSNSADYKKVFEKFTNLESGVLLTNSKVAENDTSLQSLIRNIISNDVVSGVKNTIDFLNKLDTLLSENMLDKSFFTNFIASTSEAVKPRADARKISFLVNTIDDLKQFSEFSTLITNSQNTGFGDEIQKLINKSIVDSASVDDNEIKDLKVKIIGLNANPVFNTIKLRMLAIIDFVFSKKLLNRILLGLNDLTNPSSKIRKEFETDKGAFYKELNKKISETRDAVTVPPLKAAEAVRPEIFKEATEILEKIKTISAKSEGTLSDEEQTSLPKLKFLSNGFSEVYNSLAEAMKVAAEVKKTITEAQKVLSDQRTKVIAAQNAENQKKYNDAISNDLILKTALKTAYDNKKLNDDEISPLLVKINSFLNEEQKLQFLTLNTNKAKTDFDASALTYMNAKKELQTFVDNLLTTALDAAQNANLTSLKTMLAAKKTELETTQNKIISNKNASDDILFKAGQATLNRNEFRDFRNKLIEIMSAENSLKTNEIEIKKVTDELNILKSISAENLTNKQKEDLILNQYQLDILQKNSVKLRENLEKTKSNLSALKNKVVANLTMEQGNKFSSLETENEIQHEAMNQLNGEISGLETKIQTLEKTGIDTLQEGSEQLANFNALKLKLNNEQTKFNAAKVLFTDFKNKTSVINNLISIVLSNAELSKYNELNAKVPMLNDAIKVAMINVTNNNTILDELSTLESNDTTSLREAERIKTLNAKKTVDNIDGLEFNTKNNVAMGLIELNIVFNKTTKAYSLMSVKTLETQRDNLQSQLDALDKTTPEGLKKATELEENLSTTNKSISDIMSSVKKLTSDIQKLTFSKDYQNSLLKILIKGYNANLAKIKEIENDLDITKIPDLQNQYFAELETFFDNLKKDSKSLTWNKNFVDQIDAIINYFKSKTTIEKLFNTNEKVNDSKKGELFNETITNLTNAISEIKKLNINTPSLAPFLQNINSSIANSDARNKLFEAARSYFSLPSEVSMMVFEAAKNEISVMLQNANLALETAKSLPDTEATKADRVVSETINLAQVKQIDDVAKQLSVYEENAKQLLPTFQNLSTLSDSAVNKVIMERKNQLEAFKDDDSNFLLFNSRAWISQALDTLSSMLNEKETINKIKDLVAAFIQNNSIENFEKLYSAVKSALENKINVETFSTIKEQLDKFAEALNSYNVSNVDSPNTIVKATTDLNNSRIQILGIANAENSTKERKDFANSVVLLIDKLLNNLKNSGNDLSDIRNELAEAQKDFLFYVSNASIMRLHDVINRANLVRISTKGLDEILKMISEISKLETLSLELNDILKHNMLPKFNNDLETLKQTFIANEALGNENNPLRVVYDELAARLLNLSEDSQIFAGNADTRALKIMLDKLDSDMKLIDTTITNQQFFDLKTKIDALVTSSANELAVKKALVERQKKLKIYFDTREIISSIKSFDDDYKLNDLNALLEKSQNNPYRAIIKILNDSKVRNDKYSEVLKLPVNDSYIGNIMSIKTMGQNLERNTNLIKESSDLFISAFGTLMNNLEKNMSMLVSFQSDLLDGIKDLNTAKLLKAQKEFEMYASMVKPSNEAEYKTIFNLLKNWELNISQSIKGDVSALFHIRKIKEAVKKLDKIPPVITNNIHAKIDLINEQSGSQILLIILGVFVLLISGIIIIFPKLKKSFKKKKKD